LLTIFIVTVAYPCLRCIDNVGWCQRMTSAVSCNRHRRDFVYYDGGPCIFAFHCIVLYRDFLTWPK